MGNLFKYFFPLLLTGCFSDNSFYSDYSKGDLSRVPLIKPYELISNFTKENDFAHTWNLSLSKYYSTLKNTKLNFLNVRSINIQDSIIFGGPGKHERNAFPDFWFIVNTKVSDEMIFEDKIKWESKLISLGVWKDTLYDVWPIFETFKENGKLPWNIGIK